MTTHKIDLNQKQILTLKLAYKFRYLTTHTLSRRRNITQNSAQSALSILCSRGYLVRIYDSSYKLLGKPARYCLTPKAVAYLSNDEHGLSKNVLQSRRYEANKQQDFIDLQVDIFKTYLNIKEASKDELVILTASEMANVYGFIKPYPNLFVRNPTSGKQYFIELTDGQHLFLVKKRIRRYIDHIETEVWSEGSYPEVIFIRDSSSDRRRLKFYAENQMDERYLDTTEISFKIVSSSKLLKLVASS